LIQPHNNCTVFIVNNLEAAKGFYTRHFGFVVALENDWYLHLITEIGIQVGFMLPNQPIQPEQFRTAFSGSGIIFSLEVGNVETAYADAQVQKMDIVLALRSEDWGQRHFIVRDPNGILVDIFQTSNAPKG